MSGRRAAQFRLFAAGLRRAPAGKIPALLQRARPSCGGQACRAPTDARGCGERHPPRLPRPASFTCPENCGPKNRLDWIAVGVNEVDFAEVQLPDAWLDFRAVTDHDPYEIVRMENLLCRGIEVRGGQRAD